MTICRGLLSDYFDGVAVKRLSAVEANVLRSNQHEFNSSNQFKALLGTPDRIRYDATFIWLGAEQEAISDTGFLTWYESRKPPRSEHRLYFPTNSVVSLANEGDSLFIARRTGNTLLAIIAPGQSTVEQQLRWLFSLDDPGGSVEAVEITRSTSPELGFAARYILDELGVEFEEPEAEMLDRILAPFGKAFPTTAVFSRLARESLPDVDPRDDADLALSLWLEREEAMFKRLERLIVADRLRNGFFAGDDADVDGFLSFSLSVQNRRKSRAGQSLENHLETVFKARALKFDRGATTEGKSKPDFLFPGGNEYHDPVFPPARLTLLGSKSTCKDRWRQVLSEGARVPEKHLVTLEPAISEAQTDEMRANRLQLVLPKSLHATFKPAQQVWLMDLTGFITMVEARHCE
jgi:hypothetical protein